MATLTAPQALTTYPMAKPAIAGVVCAAVGTLNVTANPTISDIWQICRVPAYSTILGGTIFAPVLDSAGSKTFNASFGWEANGEDTANATGLGTLGVQTASGYAYPLVGTLINGPKTFNRETILSLTIIAAATTFAAGTISAVVYYRNKDF